MLALAFLAQNLALGLSYGTYGAFVLHFVEEFDAPLSLAGSGLAITALVMGWLHDLSGNYHLAFVLLVALYIAAAAVFARFLLRARHPAQQQG